MPENLKEAAECLRWIAKRQLSQCVELAQGPAQSDEADELVRLAEKLEKARKADLTERDQEVLASAEKKLAISKVEVGDEMQRDQCSATIQSLLSKVTSA